MFQDVCQEGACEQCDMSPLKVTHTHTLTQSLSHTPPIRLLLEPDCEGASILFIPHHK